VRQDPTRTCAILVDLPDVVILRADRIGAEFQVHVESCASRRGCPECGVIAVVKDRPVVAFVDLPVYGNPTKLFWHKRRFRCGDPDCEKGTWTEEDHRIAGPRMAMTDRAGRWATLEVGKFGRSVHEVATTLGCDWHTVNDAVVAYGKALVDHPDRFGDVDALGLDEVLFMREGSFHTQRFSTQIVDVARGQLLDVVPGRSSAEPIAWLTKKGKPWRATVRYATLDLSGPYRKVFDEMLPGATQVADPCSPTAASSLSTTR
jgi:transposase